MKFGLKEQVVKQIKTIFKSFSEIEEAVLYGSRAKGNFKHGSDIDLTLKGKKLNLSLINTISNKLDNLLLPYTFDISIYTQIDNPDLIAHIKRVGITFYSKK